jgi:hypothetical protein
MISYINKYYIKQGNYRKQVGDRRQGRLPAPDKWLCGSPDPIEHDKYYGWRKHQSQARYRKEEYELTWEDWQTLWPNDVWFKRGRGRDCVTLYRRDANMPWRMDNVVICKQQDKGKYYQPDRTPGGRKTL